MGKNPGPSTEELEFIFDCFLRDLPDREVLEEMEDTTFPKRNPRFIRDRRREFNAAKKVLAVKLQKATDPVVVRSREQHFNYLAEIAQSLLEGPAGKVFIDPDAPVSPDTVYDVIGDSSGIREITQSELTGDLEGNLDHAVEKYGNWELFFCFGAHLEAEHPEWGNFYGRINDNPIELVVILRTLAQRKTFKGTCPVCKEWEYYRPRV